MPLETWQQHCNSYAKIIDEGRKSAFCTALFCTAVPVIIAPFSLMGWYKRQSQLYMHCSRYGLPITRVRKADLFFPTRFATMT
jgi:hypothetical protein